MPKKTPSKKTPPKKTPPKKTPAKKTPAKKTPAKKTPAKKTPAKKKSTTRRVSKAAKPKSERRIEDAMPHEFAPELFSQPYDPELLALSMEDLRQVFVMSPENPLFESQARKELYKKKLHGHPTWDLEFACRLLLDPWDLAGEDSELQEHGVYEHAKSAVAQRISTEGRKGLLATESNGRLYVEPLNFVRWADKEGLGKWLPDYVREDLTGHASKAAKRRPGRNQEYDPKEDARITKAWANWDGYASLGKRKNWCLREFAENQNMSAHEVRLALTRHRVRKYRKS